MCLLSSKHHSLCLWGNGACALRCPAWVSPNTPQTPVLKTHIPFPLARHTPLHFPSSLHPVTHQLGILDQVVFVKWVSYLINTYISLFHTWSKIHFTLDKKINKYLSSQARERLHQTPFKLFTVLSGEQSIPIDRLQGIHYFNQGSHLLHLHFLYHFTIYSKQERKKKIIVPGMERDVWC